MNRSRSRRRALAVTVAAGVALAGGLGVVLADSAGAAAPPKASAPASAFHSAQTAVQPISTSSAKPSAGATRSTAAAPTTEAVAKTLSSTLSPSGKEQLNPTQLPAVTAEKWKAVGTPSTRDVAGHDIGENECAKVDNASTWTQQGFSGGDGENAAIQDTFTFTSAAAAQAAYQNVVTGMDSCQQTSRTLQAQNKTTVDASVTKTATRPDADAWKRTWTGVMGMSAQGPQTNHLYLAVNGTRLIVLQFSEFPGHAAPYDAAADPQVLAMLDAALTG